jgi:hypothetical protein
MSSAKRKTKPRQSRQRSSRSSKSKQDSSLDSPEVEVRQVLSQDVARIKGDIPTKDQLIEVLLEAAIDRAILGNPAGRPPRRQLAIWELLVKLLNRNIKVEINGKIRTVRKHRALYMRLAQKASQHDRAALELLIALYEDLPSPALSLRARRFSITG